MCLILFAIDAHPDYPLVIASNRDETYDRPTSTLDFWDDAPALLAGRDLTAGGTWFGLMGNGRWAAVTNVREGADSRRHPRSRGHLVREYLLGQDGPAEFTARTRSTADQYGGFNLLMGRPGECLFWSNRSRSDETGTAEPRQLGPGVYGLANGDLESDWPKVTTGCAALRRTLQAGPTAVALLGLLRDDQQPPDHLLPDTGIGIERERLLARRFIADQSYGTRASTAVIMDSTGSLEVLEQSYGPGGSRGQLTRRSMVVDRYDRRENS